MQIANTWKCFKNTDALNLPHKSWSIGHGCCPGIGIFQSSLRDSNVQPWLRATGHPFSSVNLVDSPFLPTLKLMTKLRSWKWENAVVRARNSTGGTRRKIYSGYLFMCDFCHRILSFSTLLPEDLGSFFPYLCHLYSWAGALTQAFISWSVVWTPLGNLILVASMHKWPAFIIDVQYF